MAHLSKLSAAALVMLAAACSTDEPAKIQPPASPHAQDPAPVAAQKPAANKAELGRPAPDFTLKDLAGKEHSLAAYKGKMVVLEWFSPGCPTCKWAYSTGPLVDMPEALAKDGIVWLSVNSEAPANASASVEKNQEFVKKYHMEAPVLLDPKGTVGRAYGAKTTPHMFVIDAEGTLVYRGALDNAPNGKVSGDGERIDYVGDAIADVKAKRPVRIDDTKPYG